MNNYDRTLKIFDEEYLKEAQPILSNWLGRDLHISETEEIINNLLDLEELMRELNKKSLMKGNNFDRINNTKSEEKQL